MRWIRNTAGHQDALLTMTWVAFLALLYKVIVSGATLTIAGVLYQAGTVDAGIIAALLTPLLSGYVARRYTDAKFASDVAAIEDRDEADAAAHRNPRRRDPGPVIVVPTKEPPP